MTTSTDLLIRICGIYDVQAYQRVKRASMTLARELELALIHAVDGRAGTPTDHCDAVTRLGKWEFCLQHNTKNAAGNAADQARCPGRCVQILGTPNPGWISAGDFLEQHGVPASEVGVLIFTTMQHVAATTYEQRQLPV